MRCPKCKLSLIDLKKNETIADEYWLAKVKLTCENGHDYVMTGQEYWSRLFIEQLARTGQFPKTIWGCDVFVSQIKERKIKRGEVGRWGGDNKDDPEHSNLRDEFICYEMEAKDVGDTELKKKHIEERWKRLLLRYNNKHRT
jgi:hypothetical protein